MNIKTTGDLFTASASSHSRKTVLALVLSNGRKIRKRSVDRIAWNRIHTYPFGTWTIKTSIFVTSLHSTYLCKQRNIVLLWKAVNTEAVFILLQSYMDSCGKSPWWVFFSLVPCFHHIWFLPTQVLFAFDRSGHYSRKKNRERTTTPHKDLASSVNKNFRSKIVNNITMYVIL